MTYPVDKIGVRKIDGKRGHDEIGNGERDETVTRFACKSTAKPHHNDDGDIANDGQEARAPIKDPQCQPDGGRENGQMAGWHFRVPTHTHNKEFLAQIPKTKI